MRLATLIVGAFWIGAAMADQHVHGYFRHDGTYVQSYHRTKSNNQRLDNYSSSGNVNPYTGQGGHERNEYSDPPRYNKQDYRYDPALSDDSVKESN